MDCLIKIESGFVSFQKLPNKMFNKMPAINIEAWHCSELINLSQNGMSEKFSEIEF